VEGVAHQGGAWVRHLDETGYRKGVGVSGCMFGMAGRYPTQEAARPWWGLTNELFDLGTAGRASG
jgi:hypothetical protein